MARLTGCKVFMTLGILAFCLVLASAASACVGVRPLAMGGAFTGLADTADATYWNPAGLVQLESASGTFMHTLTNRDKINYQDFLSYATPMKNNRAIAVSWISYKLSMDDDQDWLWVSAAQKINETTSIGINVKSINDSLAGVDTDMAIDLAIHKKISDKWSVGLLIQNANEPKTTIEGIGSLKWVRNWRPGIAFRPDETSVFTADIYDLMDDGDAQSLRIGYEKILQNGIAVRAGYYGLGMDDASALTFGVGKAQQRDSSGRVKGTDMGIAVMIGDVDAVLGSFSVQF